MFGPTALPLKIASGPIDPHRFAHVGQGGFVFIESESAIIAKPDHLNLHLTAKTVAFFPCSLLNFVLFWLSQISLDSRHKGSTDMNGAIVLNTTVPLF